ncbi:PKD domain-containing protein [Chitinophaga pollutisoli]|uniref:PKD domain-containing protein n=1 Tax=Chitinophaga pollutisoli TaxID=3133966 RepID=A0ABZ2YJA4_9BACT
MKSTRPIGIFSLLQIVLLVLITGKAQSQEAAHDHGSISAAIEFVENKGQWADPFEFRANLGGVNIYLKKNAIRMLFLHPGDMKQVLDNQHGVPKDITGGGKPPIIHIDKKKNQTRAISSPVPGDDSPGGGGNGGGYVPGQVRGHAYEVSFLQANPNPVITASKPSRENISYFRGKDRSRWKSGISAYTSVLYENLYPNTDMQVYSESGQMKYDFIVRPGGNPDAIRMEYSGAQSMSLKKGNLHIQTSVGEIVELMPFAYQFIDNQRKKVNVQYQLKGNTLSFKVSGRYDNAYPLVIDPVVVFATLTGSRADNWGYTATYDDAGNFYGGGIARAPGFPTTTGAIQSAFRGGDCDMAIVKFNATGSRLLYSTYIGGAADDQPHSLFVDGAGNLVISGRTNSSDFPSDKTIGPGGGDSHDIVVAKINANATDIIGCLRIGGTGLDGANMRTEKTGPIYQLLRNYGDDARSEVVLDGAGNIYVAGCTQSADFPTTAGAFQRTFGGAQDGVVIKINPNCSDIIWSTYLGGNQADAAYVLALNGGNSIYVAGGTASSNFPMRGSGVYNAYRGGQCDGFIAQLSADGSNVLNSTFLGSDNGRADQVYGIQLDRLGDVYVMGTTEGNWPIRQPAGTPTFYNDNSRQFIAKLRPNLSAFIYSTTFGTASSAPSISPVAFLVDRCQNVYVSGWGGELNHQFHANASTRGLPITPDARQSRTDGSDFYFFVMKRDALGILYGTYFGGSGLLEHVDGGTSRFDRNGVIYQGICASCQLRPPRVRFPTTAGSYYTGMTDVCNFGALKIAFNLDGVRAGFTTQERRRNYCTPANITFLDTTNVTAVEWIWNFGDGSPEVRGTSPTVTHDYPNVGDYNVRLVKYDPASCNVYDTAFMPIRVRNDEATVSFTEQRQPPCTALEYEFTNRSTWPAGKPFTDTSFVWDFGDNSPLVRAGMANQTHRYASEGLYTVRLRLVDTNYCNAPDEYAIQLRVAANVVAAFASPDSACAPFTVQFDNISAGGTEFEWDFGDGSPISRDIYPTHTFTQPNRYLVTLRAYDPNTCNLRDTVQRWITIMPGPTAAYTYLPTKAVENTPTTFTNQSVDAVRYRWDFGDGNISYEPNPTHQYLRSGIYEVCLTAYTEYGCEDTVCQEVQAIVNPLYDVPTAFSPNGDGINDKWEIKGFGIVRYDMKVFNRWGQLMFQSNDQRLGWDGRFNGTVQPMDAYAFVLNVEFTDGNKITKTGNVTLLR